MAGTYNPWTGSYEDANGQLLASGGPSATAGGARLIGGITDLIGSKDRIAGYESEYNKAKSDIESWYADADSKYKLSMDPTLASAYKLQEGYKTNLDPLQLRQANVLNTLGGADARTMLTGLSLATDPTAEIQARQADFMNTIEARKGLGQTQQQIDQANLTRQYEIDLRKLGYSEEAARTAAQNKAAEELARREAIGNIVSGTVETVIPFMLEDGGRIPSYMDGGNVLAQIMGGGGGGPMGGPMGGGIPPVQGPLPGEASHETNPMHIVDKNGVKQGEAMGGESIVNHEQTEQIMEGRDKIKEIIDDGREPSQEEWMAFYESIDGVFGQPQFEGEAMA
jgi:hypothetical protein